MDRIALGGLRAYGRHGNNPGERERAQPFDLEVVLYLDLAMPQASDELAQSVDYGELQQRLVGVVESTSFSLLERLAGELLNEIFSDPRVARAVVTIAKPEALTQGVPSVSLDRKNPGYRAPS